MLRRILAVVAGLVVFIALVAAFDGLSGALFPPPSGMEPNNPDSIREHAANVPVAALAIVLAGSTLGALAGSYLTALLVGAPLSFWPYVTGAVALVATAVNAFTIPHPVWFVAAAPLAVIGATVLGAWLAGRRGGTAPRPRAAAKPQTGRGR